MIVQLYFGELLKSINIVEMVELIERDIIFPHDRDQPFIGHFYY